MKYLLKEVGYEDKESLQLLDKFYNQVYEKAFPDINERESLESITDYLMKKQSGWYGRNNYHILIMYDDKNIIGGIIFDYFCKSNSGVIEFVCIADEYKKQGYASRLYKKAVELINEDAIKSNGKEADNVFIEIDYITPDKTDLSYLFFWNKNGFKKLDFKYIQPSLSENKEAVETLHLAVYTYSKKEFILKEEVIDFVCDYAKYAMRINEPLQNSSVKIMLENIPAKISLKEIM